MEWMDDKDAILTLIQYPEDIFEKFTDLQFTGYSVSYVGEVVKVNFKVIGKGQVCLICYMEVNEVWDAFAMMYNSFVSSAFSPVWKIDIFAQRRLDKLKGID